MAALGRAYTHSCGKVLTCGKGDDKSNAAARALSLRSRFRSLDLTQDRLRGSPCWLEKCMTDSKDLTAHRNAIDAIDQNLVQLLSQRVKHASAIGAIKSANGADYYDPSREAQVMKKLSELNTGPIRDETLRAIYREIISASIALEKKLVIAYLGPPATYTHQASIRNFGISLEHRPMKTIHDVFAEVESGRVDYGVLPIENSTEGAVFHSMDNLVESDLLICSQVYLPIEHCLLSNSPLSEITAVYSKDQALGQCREWLRRHLPDASLVEVASTGAAAEKAATTPGIAAIASELSAELNNLNILERGVQDSDHNTTRFLVLGRTQAKPLGEGRDKTSLVISLSDQPGALEKALQPFASRGINLTKIESRPSRKKAWDYYFFVDLIGHITDPVIAGAIDELKANSLFVKWLGSYPNC